MKINKKSKFLKEKIESNNVKIISGQPGSGKTFFCSLIPNISNLKTIYLSNSLNNDIINNSKNPILNAFTLSPKFLKSNDASKIDFNNLKKIEIFILDIKNKYIDIIEEIIESAKRLKEKINLIIDELPLEINQIKRISENKNLNLIFLTQDQIFKFKEIYNISSFFAFCSFYNNINSNILEMKIKNLNSGDFLFIENINNSENYIEFFLKDIVDLKNIKFNNRLGIFFVKFIKDNFSILIKKNNITFSNENYIIKTLTINNSNHITILKIIDKNSKNINYFNLDLSIYEFQEFFIKEYYVFDKGIYKILRY